mgnify:CR=1 FL=1
MRLLLLAPCSLLLATLCPAAPHVVLIMTDDQGYGDLACHGNKILKTPALDRLHADSVRLTNYHVDPTCSPTRSALLTGRYSTRTGVWHTIMGRSLMHTDEVTLAEVLAASSYRTGCFGKWHLGDNYPLRPQDQGFHEVLVHGGGGVGQTPDFFGNDYFDDTYWHNGRVVKQKGYCTDVFFDAAMKFIADTSRPTVGKARPFFCYIPTNAAHGPFLVADRYKKPYLDAGVPARRAAFYGMITNIDENVARLRKQLAASGLADNTLLIFTTDNGTAKRSLHQVIDGKHIRRPVSSRIGGKLVPGGKGNLSDDGTHVPLLASWPGRIKPGSTTDHLVDMSDFLPTFCEIGGCPTPAKVDGRSLLNTLKGSEEKHRDWIYMWYSRNGVNKQARQFARTQRYKLYGDGRFFDVEKDRKSTRLNSSHALISYAVFCLKKKI